jgi:general secretion pathway protein G
MLVVMAIVALLLTISLPRYFGSLEKAKVATLRENLHVLRTTIDKFYADKGRYPEALDDLVLASYLRTVPVDPVTESNQSWVLVPSSEPGRSGIVDVRSGAVGKSKDGQVYGEL